ncbi:MAG: HD-GYP domain-containing protein [Acidimicrobiales bacterium]
MIVATLLRVVLVLCPVSVAAGIGVLVSRSIPTTSVATLVLRVVATAAVSVLAFLVVERLAHRFLPLAALLRLNLVFPDRAPSRFSVALRSSSVRKLQQWAKQARPDDGAAVVAEKVVTLAAALNTHDRRTRGHCERTRALSDLIVEELHLSPTEANGVRWGSFLHDIGKLVVPAEILNKPGKPSEREWEILRSHPAAGARLVEPLRPFLGPGVDAVGSHHESFDGSGYPAGLHGDELPLAARIVAVADAFEVMTAVRAYKRPMSLQAARAELARRSGTQFDPTMVRALLNVSLGRLRWSLGIAAWMAELPLLTVLPRAAAQAGATVGSGALAPVSLPGVAAASLGAMAVIGHVHAPPTTSAATAARASTAPRDVASRPSTVPGSWSPPAVTGGSSPGVTPTGPGGSPAAPTGVVGSVTKVVTGSEPLTTLSSVGSRVTATVSAIAGAVGASVPPVSTVGSDVSSVAQSIVDTTASAVDRVPDVPSDVVALVTGATSGGESATPGSGA